MKFILTVLVVSALLAGMLANASAQEPLKLGSKEIKGSIEPIALPKLSPTLPTIPPTALGGNVETTVRDLSTIGKKAAPSIPTTAIMGATPITVTPSFSIVNKNITTEANTVFTLPQAVAANPMVYTPPIAIFGGA
jgi:hypothetical protein